jgi:mono/diheme cytochrome c family protein
MRRLALRSLILVLALVLVLISMHGFRSRRAGPAHENRLAPPAPNQATAPAQAATNPPDGFYLAQGGQRAYVHYATPDPVLRSFMQSVMDGSSDPNAKGKEIFLRICAACHQPDGGGKDGLAPPLQGSDWIMAPEGGRLARIVLNGLKGPVRVNGKDWNLEMPPLRENLSDDQVAVVLSYVRSHLGTNRAANINPQAVAVARQEPHKQPQTVAELLQIPDR